MVDTPLLCLSRVSKSYVSASETVRVVSDLSLSIERGESVALMGPSGSGKSTVLKLAGLVDRADEGDVLLDGESTKDLGLDARRRLRARKIGFVLQEDGLLEDFTAIENVALPLLIARRPKTDSFERAKAVLSDVGLERLSNRLPSRLSGGERQRVAIARALVTSPSLLIADEPTGALDAGNAARVVEIILNAIGRHIGAALIATHDPFVARELSRTHRLRQTEIKENVR